MGIIGKGNTSAASGTPLPYVAAPLGQDGADDCDSISSSGGEPCAICYDDYRSSDTVKHLPCGHFYHAACIDEVRAGWLAGWLDSL